MEKAETKSESFVFRGKAESFSSSEGLSCAAIKNREISVVQNSFLFSGGCSV